MDTQTLKVEETASNIGMIESNIVLAFEQINELRGKPIDTTDIRVIDLYGDNGAFDSLGLVTFLNMVETVFSEESETTVSLMSEKAMSQKNSPFLNVSNLISFIQSELS